MLFLWHHPWLDDPCKEYIYTCQIVVVLLLPMSVNECQCLPVIHSQLDAFAHGGKLQRQRLFMMEIKVSFNFESKLLFNMHLYYLYLKTDQLVKLWICIFLNYFGRSLKRQNNNVKWTIITLREIFKNFNLTWNTFFPAKLTSKYGSTKFFLSPSPPNTCFTVWTKASSTAT